jgi:hypothetical protein
MDFHCWNRLKVVEMPTLFFEHEIVRPWPMEFTFRLSIDAGNLFKAEKVRLRVEAATGLPEFVVIEQSRDPEDQEFVYRLRSIAPAEDGVSLNDKMVEVLRKLGDRWTLHLFEHGSGLEAATKNTRVPGVTWLGISAGPWVLMPSVPMPLE